MPEDPPENASTDQPSDGKPVSLKDLARFFYGLATLRERWAEAIEEVRAELGPEPPPVDVDTLKEVLVELFLEFPNLELADTEHLAEEVARRDRSFRPNWGPSKRGRWSESVLHNRIWTVVSEAREEAAEQRAEGDPDTY